MKKNKLAIRGGQKVINFKFKRYNTIGKEETSAAIKVLKTGILSDFIAGNNSQFYGGSKVKEFERKLEKYFKVKHALTVNSWTSGLICAVGAIDIEPGDEIIVTPWTMPASATAILHWNAIPVFADINRDSFNIDIKSIEKNITKKTKAILAVSNSDNKSVDFFLTDIFGASSILPFNKYKNKNFTNKTIVETITLDSIIDQIQNKIKLIKIEAEGLEPEILKGLKKNINKVEYISVDCGERGIEKKSTKNDCSNYLLKNNFKIIDYDPVSVVCLFKNLDF